MQIPIKHLKTLSLLYAAFPLFPFFLGWIKPIIGIPLVLLLVYGIYTYAINQKKQYYHVSLLQFIGLFLLILCWISISGAGGMGFQQSDHLKNNILARDLSNNSWPLLYIIEGKTTFLAHYLGFYLPGPAVFGKLGYRYAQFATFAYSFIGIFLGMFWVLKTSNFFKWTFGIFVILFGGIHIVSFLIKFQENTLTEILFRMNNHGYVFWSNSWDILPLNFLNLTSMTQWTPQHFIPGLLGAGILLQDGVIEKNIKYSPFFLSILAFWSPLVLVGLAPYLLYFVIKGRFSKVFNHINLLVAPVIFLVVAIYFAALDSGELLKHFIFSLPQKNNFSLIEKIGTYIYFLFFEVLIWLIPIWVYLRPKLDNANKGLLSILSITICLIPLYRFGIWNDWCSRVSIASLVFLAYFTWKALNQTKPTAKIIFSCLLLFSSLGPVIDIYGSLKHTNFSVRFMPPDEKNMATLPEICITYPVTQFVAKDDTFFYKYLAKK